MARALIVGHTGQDGRLLWDQLSAQGFSLLGISRGTVRTAGISWDRTIDIGDAAAVARLLDEFEPEQIYFLAAHHHSSEETAKEDVVWSMSWRVNVDAFSNFLRAATRQARKPRIFYASSSRVFGNAQTSPQDESTPFRPECVYGLTKVTAMRIADYFRREKNLFVACGILFNHESPLRGSQFVSQRVVDGLVAIKNGTARALTLGSLDARVDWGYAGDYTQAMQLMLEVDQADDFVVASGRTHSVRDFVTLASAALKMDDKVVVNETARMLKRGAQDLCGNPSKIERVTGWRRHVDFAALVQLLVGGALERAESESRRRDIVGDAHAQQGQR